MATHVLDTSALLAHCFDEPGAEEVDALWQDAENRLAVCVLSLPEFKTRILEEMDDAAEAERVFDLYCTQLVDTLPVDRAVAQEAIALRAAAPGRLPLVDAVIAACAKAAAAILVHRDPHMATIPADWVRQLRLPAKR
ncbi:MAG: PIN domain-containing protein [Kiritimatiellae bacterium]|nr:PIN domain-containing protein [Kiritimatiellia bacterium]